MTGRTIFKPLKRSDCTTAIFNGQQQGPDYVTWISTQCYVPIWMGEGFKGEWEHVYVWLSPCTPHLKLLTALLISLYPNTK